VTALGPGAGWTLAIAGLGLLALILFFLAVRFGHWGVWLAGYLCVVLALVIAMVAGHRREAKAAEPEGPAAVAQPSAGSGVLPVVDFPGQRWAWTAALDEVI
jgi:hypothetical protein